MPVTAGSRALAAHAAKMAKKYGEERVSNGPPPVIVSSGSIALDFALGVGGYQRGRLYEFLGLKDSGKSTMAILAMISHARAFPDRGVCYVNMEKTFSPERATAMGLDCSDEAKAAGRWMPLLPSSSEQASDMARDNIASGLYSIVVIDSIGAMESSRTLEKEAEKAADSVGRNAKIITQMTKALSDYANEYQCTVILVNQPRANIGGMGGDVSAGPRLMQHSTTAKVEFRALGGADNIRTQKFLGDEDPLTVSVKSRLRVTRAKNALPGRVAEIYLNRVGTELYGPPGVDNADSYVTLATRLRLVKQGGAWYTFPDGTTKFNGRPAFEKAVREDEGLRKMIRDSVLFTAPADPLLDDETEGDA